MCECVTLPHNTEVWISYISILNNMFCYSLCIVLKVLHELSWECDRLYPIPTITYSINKKINTINRNIYTHHKSSTYAFSCCKFLFSDFLITSINIHTGKTGIKKIKKTITTLQTFQPNINFNLPIDVYTKNTYMNLHTQKKNTCFNMKDNF